MRIGFVVNDIAVEKPEYTTVRLALVAAARGHETWLMGVGDFSHHPDGTVDPHGYWHIQAFALEGMLPVWTFALGDALLERRIWMAPGARTCPAGVVLV